MTELALALAGRRGQRRRRTVSSPVSSLPRLVQRAGMVDGHSPSAGHATMGGSL